MDTVLIITIAVVTFISVAVVVMLLSWNGGPPTPESIARQSRERELIESQDPRERAKWEASRRAQRILHAKLEQEGTPSSPQGSKSDQLPKAALTDAESGSRRSEQHRRWDLARTAFRDAQVRMARYETDPALAIDFPAFNDVSVPEVKTMIAALRRASHLMDASDADRGVSGSPELLREIEDSVVDFSTAIGAAERAARRLKWSHLNAPDRQDLAQIRGLLQHAENPGNTDEARLNYYAQLQRVVRRLNERHGHPVIPAAVTAELDGQARLSLS